MKQLLTDGRTTDGSPENYVLRPLLLEEAQELNDISILTVSVSVTNVSYEHFHSAETGYAQHLNSHLSP